MPIHQRERLAKALSGRYMIEGELGQGGMAVVYRARDLKHDRLVAIKVFKPELAHALGPERFLREIKVTAQLSHPHILPLLDSGEADGLLFYVTPYVEGERFRPVIGLIAVLRGTLKPSLFPYTPEGSGIKALNGTPDCARNDPPTTSGNPFEKV